MVHVNIFSNVIICKIMRPGKLQFILQTDIKLHFIFLL